MEQTIWKFQIGLDDKIQDIIMPMTASILCFQIQSGVPAFWARVEKGTENGIRRFRLFATGEKLLTDPMKYIGTVQIWETVWHLFELV